MLVLELRPSWLHQKPSHQKTAIIKNSIVYHISWCSVQVLATMFHNVQDGKLPVRLSQYKLSTEPLYLILDVMIQRSSGKQKTWLLWLSSLFTPISFCVQSLLLFFASPSTAKVLQTTTMPALNACLQVARIAEASGIPYIEKLTKVTIAIMELLEQRGRNKKDVKALCKSIANTVVVINTVVSMNEELGVACFKEICGDMEEYL
ncbi:hypothetical protein EDD18DRAFT_1186140, partial [Armillaria luteobubalina]